MNPDERLANLERQLAELRMQADPPTPSPLARRLERVATDRRGSALLAWLATLAAALAAWGMAQ